MAWTLAHRWSRPGHLPATAGALGLEVQPGGALDRTRTELVRRCWRRRGSEDTEAVIERRLQGYLDKTVPLLAYYADRERIFTVDGAQSPDAVHADIVADLQKLADLAAGTRHGVSRR